MSQHDLTIAAVIVSSDGGSWLPELLASLRAQTRPVDHIVAVDNASSDGSRELLVAELGPDRVLPSSQDLGFPAAANMGAAAVPGVDCLLFVHDDVVLEQSAVAELVAVLESDTRVAAVGPKVVARDDPRRLLSMGMTLDRFGQVHGHVLDQERDQGQGQVGARHLAVTSATVLVRADVFTMLGGFDARFEMYRDDLDLCWRMWLAGWEVTIAPDARVAHRRAGSVHGRDARSAFTGPRYYRERNTLASIIKNVSGMRSLVAVIGFVVFALVRAAWMVVTRRLSEGWQILQAIGWNVVHLRGTLRLRARTQRHQRRTAAQIEHLFAGIGPQARHLASVLGDLVSGTDDTPPELLRIDPELPWHRRTFAMVRRHPALVVGVILVVFGAVVSIPVLLPNQLRLGEFMPFVDSGRQAMSDHLAAWHAGGAMGTTVAPSPSQFLVGLLQFVLGNSEWLTARVLLLGLPMVAWLGGQVAMRPWIPTRGPRVAAATFFVVSPPMVAAMRGGRLSVLVTGAMLPVVAAGLGVALRRSSGTNVDAAWRGAAFAGLAAAGMVAFNPSTAWALAVVLLVLALVVGVRRDSSVGRRWAWIRLGLVAVGTPALLLPWWPRVFSQLVTVPSDLLPLDAAASPMWQWMLLAPQQFGFPPVLVGAGFVAAFVVSIALATRRHPGASVGLALATVGLIGLAGWLDGQGLDTPAWPGTALLVAAALAAALFGLGLRHARATMVGHSFGWRQVGTALGMLAAVGGVIGTGGDLLLDGWAADRGPVDLPDFVMAAPDNGAHHQVLTIADTGDEVSWEVVPVGGASMATHGVEPSPTAREAITTLVTQMVDQANPAAGGELALRGVQWVVVPESGMTPELIEGLDRQFALRSESTVGWSVYRLPNPAPQLGLVSAEDLGTVVGSGTLPEAVEVVPVAASRVGEWTIEAADHPRAALLAPWEADAFRASSGDRALAVQTDGNVSWIDVPADTTVKVVAGDRDERRLQLLLQLFVLVLVLSVLLRPPGAQALADPAGTPPETSGGRT